MDSNLESEYPEVKGQRHFNRAMAMRSLKMGISPRALRSKRYSGTCGWYNERYIGQYILLL